MEIVIPWCSRLMAIVVPRCSHLMAIVVFVLWGRTIMVIERLHRGTTISFEYWHSVIIMFHHYISSMRN